MCLAVPGQIIKIMDDDDACADNDARSDTRADHDARAIHGAGNPEHALTRRGVVDFGGVRKEVSLALLPEARLGDYVLVHVGFAMSRIDAEQAERVFSYLDEIGATEPAEATDAASHESSPAGPSTKERP